METKEKYTQEERAKFMLFKDYIQNKAEEQRFLKNQRKTEKLVGDRKMPAWEATYKHQQNREELRVLYAAYGFIRGKSASEIESRYGEEEHPLNTGYYQTRIEKVLKQHKLLSEEE